jgi:hypothetical protein
MQGLRRVSLLTLIALSASACGSSSHPSTTPPTATSPGATAPTTQAGPPNAGQPGPEGATIEQGPFLAPASSTTPGTTVHGIQCAPLEQLAYHIHVHLQVYVDGSPRSIPGAIGMNGPVAQQTAAGPFYSASKCIYWLHTHAPDGIIHIESPTEKIYTLSDFFDEWQQPLSASAVAGASGPVTAFVNGSRWTRSPRDIPLNPHSVIQLDVGKPVVPPQPFSWAGLSL